MAWLYKKELGNLFRKMIVKIKTLMYGEGKQFNCYENHSFRFFQFGWRLEIYESTTLCSKIGSPSSKAVTNLGVHFKKILIHIIGC